MTRQVQSTLGYERGIHVRGTPLWLNPTRRVSTGAVTSLVQRPARMQRTVAETRIAECLQRLGFKHVLPASSGRWFGFAGMQMCFAPASIHSGTQLCLEHDHQRYLVVDHLVRGERPFCDADVVVAMAPHVPSAPVTMAHVADHIRDNFAHQAVRVVCDCPTLALSLKHQLIQRDVPCKFARDMRPYAQAAHHRRKANVTLGLRAPSGSQPRVFVTSGQRRLDPFELAADLFADWGELDDFAREAGAQCVAIGGRAGERLVLPSELEWVDLRPISQQNLAIA